MKERDFLILDYHAAWGRSGLSLGDFGQLVRDLQATGHVHRNRNILVFSSVRIAELLLGSGRPRRRGRRGAA